MPPISSKGASFAWRAVHNVGVYVDIDDVTSVTINDSIQAQEYGSSSTGGYKGRVGGHEDATVTVVCLADAGAFNPGFATGAKIQVKCTTDVGVEWEGDVRVASLGADVPIGDGGLVARTIELAQTVHRA